MASKKIQITFGTVQYVQDLETIPEVMEEEQTVAEITAFLDDQDILRSLTINPGLEKVAMEEDREARESREAVLELEGLLTPQPMMPAASSRPPVFPLTPAGKGKEMGRDVGGSRPVFSPVGPAKGFITPDAGASLEPDDDWSPAPSAKRTSSAARRERRNARRYNPARHFEADDFVSPSSPPSRPKVYPIPVSARVPSRSDSWKGAPNTSRTSRGSFPLKPRNEGLGDRNPFREDVSESFRGWHERSHLPVRTTGTMFGGLRRIPTRPDLDPPAGVCFVCWKRGHRRWDCQKAALHMYCYNCGRRGVDLTDCPRCSERHRERTERARAQAGSGDPATPAERIGNGSGDIGRLGKDLNKIESCPKGPTQKAVSVRSELPGEGAVSLATPPVGLRITDDRRVTGELDQILQLLKEIRALPLELQPVVVERVFGKGSRY